MQVDLIVPSETDISVIEAEYGDLCEDEGYDDEYQAYFVGKSMDECPLDSEDEWLTHDDAVVFCGFCEGAIPEARTLIEGNGGWAQSMISCKDFSIYAVSEEQKRDWQETSDRYWDAYVRGVEAAKAKNKT